MDRSAPDRTEQELRDVDESRRMELREEELVPKTRRVRAGTVRIRRETEEVPAHVEIEAEHDEVEIEHEPIGREVAERRQPWDEDGVRVIPVYEEQIVVVKRLVLKEHIRIRTVHRHETRGIEDTVRRDRLVIEDPDHTGQVRERYPTGNDDDSHDDKSEGLLDRVMRRTLG